MSAQVEGDTAVGKTGVRMFNKSLLISLSFLVACGGGMSEDQFTDEMIGVTCDKVFECTTAEEIEAVGWFFGANSAECEALFEGAEVVEDTGATVECDFDSDAARTCVDAMEALSCEDWAAGTFPASCEEVCPVEDEGGEDTSAGE
jgi:hypothetical protein